ncbi:MAG: rRNA ((1402)-2-O)-methyltransferase [Pseudomonadota bacterium]
MLLQAAQQVAGRQQYPAGTLYLVATPIGNLADISLRAVQVLALVDAVACEDTRVTGQLLHMLGLHKPLLTLHQHNEREASAAIVARLQSGERIAYVSDAGTPAVSDPGAVLVAQAQLAGLACCPVPGASAVTAALSVSGDTQAQGFRFQGFLPAKGGERQQALQQLGGTASTVLFEAPHRMADLAADLAALSPLRRVTVCRELSKQFEDIATLNAAELPAWLAADAHRAKGEFVLVLHGQAAEADEALPEAWLRLLAELVAVMPVKRAAQLLADATGRPRKALYELALQQRQASEEADQGD